MTNKERDRQAKKRQPNKQIYRQNDRKEKDSLQYDT